MYMIISRTCSFNSFSLWLYFVQRWSFAMSRWSDTQRSNKCSIPSQYLLGRTISKSLSRYSLCHLVLFRCLLCYIKWAENIRICISTGRISISFSVRIYVHLEKARMENDKKFGDVHGTVIFIRSNLYHCGCLYWSCGHKVSLSLSLMLLFVLLIFPCYYNQCLTFYFICFSISISVSVSISISNTIETMNQLISFPSPQSFSRWIPCRWWPLLTSTIRPWQNQ